MVFRKSFSADHPNSDVYRQKRRNVEDSADSPGGSDAARRDRTWEGIAFAADGPTDPQIVGIVLAADQIDIDYGKIALSKSENKQVREFANCMVTDHSAVQKNVIDHKGISGGAEFFMGGSKDERLAGYVVGDVDLQGTIRRCNTLQRRSPFSRSEG